jgi:uncharacterized membrane protein
MDAMQRKTHTVELALARLLRIGAMAAAVLMGLGVLLTLLGLAAGTTVITIGLIVLVSTPVMRVVVAGLVFLKEKDMLFALFCGIVLLSLVGGMLIGQVH